VLYAKSRQLASRVFIDGLVETVAPRL